MGCQYCRRSWATCQMSKLPTLVVNKQVSAKMEFLSETVQITILIFAVFVLFFNEFLIYYIVLWKVFDLNIFLKRRNSLINLFFHSICCCSVNGRNWQEAMHRSKQWWLPIHICSARPEDIGLINCVVSGKCVEHFRHQRNCFDQMLHSFLVMFSTKVTLPMIRNLWNILLDFMICLPARHQFTASLAITTLDFITSERGFDSLFFIDFPVKVYLVSDFIRMHSIAFFIS